MSNFSLVENLYLHPTPGGAYYAVSTKNDDKSKTFLNALLQQEETPQLTLDNLMMLTGINNEDKCMQLLHHCQKLGWVGYRVCVVR